MCHTESVYGLELHVRLVVGAYIHEGYTKLSSFLEQNRFRTTLQVNNIMKSSLWDKYNAGVLEIHTW